LGYSPIRENHQTIEAIITFIRKIEKKLPLDITKSSTFHPCGGGKGRVLFSILLHINQYYEFNFQISELRQN
jgi:hypothetical protein